ncbi:MAG: hypothetical protein HY370_05175 [Proteobacteria bacterium]|nr:hypothetical protein [Pseudomonadota bacterium]
MINIPSATMRNLLEATDDFAVSNVRAGRGGPFGASIHLVRLTDMAVTPVGALAANAVLATGMGSAHAEDQALSPGNITILKEALRNAPGIDHAVLFSSSGESCPACHSKLEIVSRTLTAEGLLPPGRFIVTYGATYRDTAAVAGFNDEPYHQDMRKPPESRLIRLETKANNIDDAISALFNGYVGGTFAVVLTPGGALYPGFEGRPADLFGTSEVSAIRNACQAAKSQGRDTPWNLGGATLYTGTTEIGPLTYAECQWANVTRIIKMPHAAPSAPEAPGISNSAFFNVIADAQYNQPGHALTVIHIAPFANRAQYAWAEKLAAEKDPNKVLYNGVKIVPGPQ